MSLSTHLQRPARRIPAWGTTSNFLYCRNRDYFSIVALVTHVLPQSGQSSQDGVLTTYQISSCKARGGFLGSSDFDDQLVWRYLFRDQFPATSGTDDQYLEDYYATIYSAEIVNTLTNLLFISLGIKGIRNCLKYDHDSVFLVAFIGCKTAPYTCTIGMLSCNRPACWKRIICFPYFSQV